MRSTAGRRELAFVVGLASAGLALVMVVVFTPWYPSGPAPVAEVTRVKQQVVRLVDGQEGGVAITR
jgi:hypothetical protein